MTSLLLFLPQVFAFLVGACVGSFLNVCAYRIPLDRSLVFPGSHCAACGAPIPPYNNIPILSWLILRGRTGCCQTRIDFRYFVVELGTACLFAALWGRYSETPLLGAIYAIFISGLIVSSLIDLDYFIIPDRFTLGGCVAGFIFSAIDPKLQQGSSPVEPSIVAAFGWSIAGALVGGLVLLAIGNLGTLLFKKEAMGFGDVKFAAAMCAFLGAESITFILPVSALCGAILGMLIIFLSKGSWGTRIPYGPFLAIGAAAWIFGGESVTRDYWNNIIGRLVQLTGFGSPSN